MVRMFNRRTLLGGLAAGIALPVFAARAAPPIDAATEFKLTAGSGADQSAKLQAALSKAASQGRLLLLPLS